MKIVVDGSEVQSFDPTSLPMLIHGREGSGASKYTIALAAKGFGQGHDILFLCGYPMAEEEFVSLVGSKPSSVHFYTKEKTSEFIQALKQDVSNRIVFIKNVELFEKDVIDLAVKENSIVISGDIQQSVFRDDLMGKQYATKIYFSDLGDFTLPGVSKYEGYIVSDSVKGVTRLEL